VCSSDLWDRWGCTAGIPPHCLLQPHQYGQDRGIVFDSGNPGLDFDEPS